MLDISLREELNSLVESLGVNVLYIRNNKKIRCKCYEEKYKSGNPSCPACYGSGSITVMEKIRTVYDNGTSTKDKLINNGIGLIHDDEIHFYCRFNIAPKVSDLICITGWDGDKPEEIKRVYQIKSCDEMRFDRGRIEGYFLMGKLKPDMASRIQAVLNKMPPSSKNILAKGGRLPCPYNEA